MWDGKDDIEGEGDWEGLRVELALPVGPTCVPETEVVMVGEVDGEREVDIDGVVDKEEEGEREGKREGVTEGDVKLDLVA